eukprot:TRINITY_DN43130_c0_g1_i1.p1 TRINITY_DN43130_c0_g1~~TRINITY_DN43130_c0_g1_i1.p1  ORF type:complete len:353 (+),score=43.50 TRINITY_DN43130_c0_g1_i1:61-1059(+)
MAKAFCVSPQFCYRLYLCVFVAKSIAFRSQVDMNTCKDVVPGSQRRNFALLHNILNPVFKVYKSRDDCKCAKVPWPGGGFVKTYLHGDDPACKSAHKGFRFNLEDVEGKNCSCEHGRGLAKKTDFERNATNRTVAIFADYDGCFDITSASNMENSSQFRLHLEKMLAREKKPKLHSVEEMQELLMGFVHKITAGASEVILFIGSNRQSEDIEQNCMFHNKNRHCKTSLQELASQENWTFNQARLDEVLPPKADDWSEGSKHLKRLMAEHNFRKLKGPTDVYFFDDVEPYLQSTAESADIPQNINFHTVHFSWFDLMLGDQSMELVAQGPWLR